MSWGGGVSKGFMSSWVVAKLLSPGGLLVVVMQPPRTCLATSSANGALLVLDILTTGQELGFALPWGSLSPPVPPPHWSCPQHPQGPCLPAGCGGCRGQGPCPGWSYANTAPHPSAQPVPLGILSQPRVTPALPWPPAPSCSLGKRYRGSLPPRWGERGGTWGWGNPEYPGAAGRCYSQCSVSGTALLWDALAAEPLGMRSKPLPCHSIIIGFSGVGGEAEPQRAGALWGGVAAGLGALSSGGIISQHCVAPSWAVLQWGLVLSPPPPQVKIGEEEDAVVTQTHRTLLISWGRKEHGGTCCPSTQAPCVAPRADGQRVTREWGAGVRAHSPNSTVTLFPAR